MSNVILAIGATQDAARTAIGAAASGGSVSGATAAGGTAATGAGSAHSHAVGTLAFTGTVLQLPGESVLIRPDGAGTVYVSATLSGAGQPKVATGQPDYPRAVSIVLGGAWDNTNGGAGTAVEVTILGQVRGVGGITEVITIPAMSAPAAIISGVVPFDLVPSITWTTPADWIAGDFTVESLVGKLGLPLPFTFASLGVDRVTVWDETAVPPQPVAEAIASVDGTNGTFTLTTAPDAAHSYRVRFRYTVTPAGTLAGSTAAEAAHTHAGPSHTHTAGTLTI